MNSKQHLIVRVADKVWQTITGHQLQPGKQLEELSYVFAHASQIGDTTIVTVGPHAPVCQFAPDCYEVQRGQQVRLLNDVFRSVLVQFAASSYNCLVNLHSHWFQQVPTFSGVDDRDDVSFDRYLRERFEPMLKRSPNIGPARAIYNLSIVLGQSGADARLTHVGTGHNPVPSDGHVNQCEFLPADKVHIIGEHHQALTLPRQQGCAPDAVTHIRQADFIAADKQMLLANLHIGIAGCGGLGSVIAESLARAGVGALTLVDDDTLAIHNLNRWQGGSPQDVGRSKATLLAERVSRMCPWVTVGAEPTSVYSESAEHALARCDLVVGGLDNDEARSFLNGLSLKYLLPYFDAGVAVEIPSGPGSVNFRSRYFAVLPGHNACVACSTIQLIDRKTTAEAYMNPHIAQERRAAGYVLQQPQAATPSVYALNQQSASQLVTEVLNYVCAWRPTATVMYTNWLTGQTRHLDSQTYPEPPADDCPECSLLSGAGVSEPLLRPRDWITGSAR